MNITVDVHVRLVVDYSRFLLMINRIFRIKDVVGREWGVFTVKNETIDCFDKKQIHGILKPTCSFKEVRNLFLTHDIDMSQKGLAVDTNWIDIAELKPYLIDENFMVTCSPKGM